MNAKMRPSRNPRHVTTRVIWRSQQRPSLMFKQMNSHEEGSTNLEHSVHSAGGEANGGEPQQVVGGR